ncbi:flagellar hook-length control protein FliK [Sphingomonas pruni]|uniref:flagellar hook-length control protein FliK n=1 Tax=Sphingomonas pruni TaxID=40683 RepID=UPI000A064013|nr:flagellar hook-length control protein FliK [Sphingomonas pruni]
MTGLTLSATLTAALPGKVAVPSLLAPGIAADGAPGVPNLAAFLDLMIGKAVVTAKQDQPGGERQDDAATGNPLPEKDDDKGDPALAWLLSVAPIALPAADVLKPAAAGAVTAPLTPNAANPQPSLPMLPLPAASDTGPVRPEGVAPPATPLGLQETQPLPATAPAPAAPQPATAAPITIDAALAAAADLPKPTPAAKQPIVAADRPITHQPAAQPIRITVPQAAPVTLASLASANAPMPALFALAMAPERKPAGEGENSQPGGLTAAATLLTPADAAQLVAKPGQAERQALDMGRQDWPQKMIDRIEALRDDANANDTSIRLKPEALGRIDVSLRTHADGAVTVRFAAEQPTTRALLADAAPQLSAAAEARGIRLTGTSVDLSGSGMAGGDRPRPQADVRQDSKNRLATGGDDEIRAVDDGRVA